MPDEQAADGDGERAGGFRQKGVQAGVEVNVRSGRIIICQSKYCGGAAGRFVVRIMCVVFRAGSLDTRVSVCWVETGACVVPCCSGDWLGRHGDLEPSIRPWVGPAGLDPDSFDPHHAGCCGLLPELVRCAAGDHVFQHLEYDWNRGRRFADLAGAARFETQCGDNSGLRPLAPETWNEVYDQMDKEDYQGVACSQGL